MVYEDRRKLLIKAASSGEKLLGRKFEKIRIVPDIVAENIEDINTALDNYTNEGYEGVMIYKIRY